MPSIFKNKKIIILFSILLFLVIGGFSFWNLNLKNKNVSAAGESWLSGWSQRKAITITNNDANIITGTLYGGTTLGGTAMTGFGTAASFDGSGDYITIPDSDDFSFGTADFTIDFWIQRSAISNAEEGLIGQMLDSGNGNPRNVIMLQADNKIWFYDYYYYDGTNGTLVTTTAITDLNWHHVAFVRSSGTLSAYIDGLKCGSNTWTNSGNNPNPMFLGYGRTSTGAQAYFKGKMDEVRISKGVARWTANFNSSLPTAAYANVDAYDVLLMHLDEAVGSTSTYGLKYKEALTDYQVEVGVPYTTGMKSDFSDVRFTSSDGSTELNYWLAEKVATTATVGTLNSAPVFGSTGKIGTAVFLDGSDDYISVPESADWDFGANDFTIDAWVYRTDNENSMIYSRVEASNSYLYFGWEGDSLRFRDFYTGTTYIDNSWSVPVSLNTWYHVALVRSGSNFNLYLNGVKQGSTYVYANSVMNRTIGPQIGAMTANSTYYFNGMIDELRVSKGIARWTADFTPSLIAYTPDQYTKLLLHFDEAVGSTSVIDHCFTKFYVKVPSLPIGNTTIYMYYGNASATSTSSGANTFVWYNDKNNLSSWTNSQTTVSVSGNDLKFIGSNVGPAYQNISFPSSFVFESKAKFAGNSYDYIELRDGTTYRNMFYQHGSMIYGYADASAASRSLVLGGGNHYYTVKAKMSGTTISFYALDDEGVVLGSYANDTTTSPVSSLYIGTDSTGGSAEIYSPWMFVRKYSSIEPLASLGPEESSISITSVSISATNSNVCKTESGKVICRSGQPIIFNSTTTGNQDMKLYICKDSTCSNCGLSSTTNCLAYSSSYATSNPTAVYDSSCYSGSCGSGKCEYSLTNEYWAKVCHSSSCSDIISYDFTSP